MGSWHVRQHRAFEGEDVVACGITETETAIRCGRRKNDVGGEEDQKSDSFYILIRLGIRR